MTHSEGDQNKETQDFDARHVFKKDKSPCFFSLLYALRGLQLWVNGLTRFVIINYRCGLVRQRLCESQLCKGTLQDLKN